MTSTSKSAADHFSDLARRHNLSPQVARQITDIHHHHVEVRKQRDYTIFDRWGRRARADAELSGGDGFAANLALARQVADRFGGNRLLTVLQQTGMGNHPELIRVFVRIGRELAKHDAKRPYDLDKALRAMYPSMYKTAR